MKYLFLLCGPAGAGKSTWAANQIKDCKYKCEIVSRDEVRFSLVSEDEQYFAKEDLVFDKFIYKINEAIHLNDAIFVDATHLNEKGRNKVLDRLFLTDVNIIPVNFMAPLDICLSQNAQRTGRKRVPEHVIEKMWYDFKPAADGEKYEYYQILSTGECNE